MDGQMNGMENLFILQDFVPYPGRCPKRLYPWAPRLRGPRGALWTPKIFFPMKKIFLKKYLTRKKWENKKWE